MTLVFTVVHQPRLFKHTLQIGFSKLYTCDESDGSASFQHADTSAAYALTNATVIEDEAAKVCPAEHRRCCAHLNHAMNLSLYLTSYNFWLVVVFVNSG